MPKKGNKMTNEQQAQVKRIQDARPDVTFAVSERDGKVVLQGKSNKADGLSWPEITIGKKAGIVVWISSYPEGDGKTAFDAAIQADVLLNKQETRRAKAQAAKTVPETTEKQTVTAGDVAKLSDVLPAGTFQTGKPNVGKEMSEDEQIAQMLEEDEQKAGKKKNRAA